MNTLTDKELSIPVENAVVVPQTGRLGFALQKTLDSLDLDLSQQADQTRLDLMAAYDEKCEPVRIFIADTIHSATEDIDPEALAVSFDYPCHNKIMEANLTFERFVNVETNDGISTILLRFAIIGALNSALRERQLDLFVEFDSPKNQPKYWGLSKRKFKKALLEYREEAVKRKAALREDAIRYVLANPAQLLIETAVLEVEQPTMDVTSYEKVTLPWSGEIMYAKPIEGANLDVSMPDSAEIAFAKSIELDKPWEELTADEAAEAVKKAAIFFAVEENAPQMNQAEIDEYTSLIMQSYP